ncbi:hypothetical protein HBN50_16345 [Halobacteriovorax sp. GB3]|uniref:hypothetical protein n=1 Tax=Halobacteriovorax sp. GB3 TaxID=2719615 RepID=UPI0023601F5D|nr:hypothetical protein [Halobacteriovorax sp. GB3]MDD0854683.1 hypothetical protein [Halobacteriovorax sp. GB3]
MKLFKAILLMSSLALVSCASKEKKEVVKEEPKFQKDYVLVDASSKTEPTWIEEPTSGDKKKESKLNRYFVSESASVSKRSCVRSASARATARIAQEVAQFMKNSYAESTQVDEGDEVSEYMEESLGQEAQTFLVGARVHKTYWEKRRYQKTLGAKEDETKYNCFALVKMSKKNLEKALKKSMQKLYGDIDDPEVKKKAKKALKGAEDAFVKLDKKVEVQSEE